MLIKNNRRLWLSLLILGLVLTLFACSDEEHMRDLSRYVASLKKAITKHKAKNIIAGIQLPEPVSFQATGKERDPFEEEQTIYGGSALNNPLTSFPLKQFEFIGLLSRNNKIWAIIRAPDNKIYQLTINDQIGNHYGRIVQIDADQLKVEESIPQQEAGETGTGVVKRIVILELKGGN